MKMRSTKIFIAGLRKALLLSMTAFSLSACGNNADKLAVTEATTEATSEAEATTEANATSEAEVASASEAAASANPPKDTKLELSDGIYKASFDTDGSMFHVNEVCEGKAVLTVKDGIGTLHIVLPSKNTVNLFYGVSEDAKKDGAELIDPVSEEVTYSDGTTEEVNSFDIPVPYLDKEYDIALIGTKGKWYNHKVKVSDPVPETETESAADAAEEKAELKENEYLVPVTLEGGSGKATVESPAKLVKTDDGYVATIAWSSPYYDYMIVNEEKYLPVNTEGNSVFEIPLKDLSAPVKVIADTVAMSKPHEIEYTLTFDISGLEN